MLTNSKAFSGFAVDDLDQARRFYGETLGIETSDGPEAALLTLHLAGGRDTIVYEKPDFVPATYTVLNFPVDDVGQAVDELRHGACASRSTRASVRTTRRDAGAGPGHRLVQGPCRQHPQRAEGA